MPDFIAQTYKSHPAGKWSNVYRFGAATLAEAQADMVDVLEDLEIPLLHSTVTLDAIRISSAAPGDDIFAIIPLGVAGTSSDGGDLLPFWNCARVDMSVIGGGRPSRKWWKGFLTESLVTAMQITSGAVGVLNTAFNAAIFTANDLGHAFHDPDGQDWDVAVTQATVAMRQMHRKRRRSPAP